MNRFVAFLGKDADKRNAERIFILAILPICQ